MSNLLTPKEREEIRERADKASPGPWKNCGRKDSQNSPVYESQNDDVSSKTKNLIGWFARWGGVKNADFIACARTDVPRLLQHIEELEKALEQAVEATGMYLESGILTTNGDRFPGNDDCPDELANYLLRLRTKEAGSGEGEKS